MKYSLRHTPVPFRWILVFLFEAFMAAEISKTIFSLPVPFYGVFLLFLIGLIALSWNTGPRQSFFHRWYGNFLLFVLTLIFIGWLSKHIPFTFIAGAAMLWRNGTRKWELVPNETLYAAYTFTLLFLSIFFGRLPSAIGISILVLSLNKWIELRRVAKLKQSVYGLLAVQVSAFAVFGGLIAVAVFSLQKTRPFFLWVVNIILSVVLEGFSALFLFLAGFFHQKRLEELLGKMTKIRPVKEQPPVNFSGHSWIATVLDVLFIAGFATFAGWFIIVMVRKIRERTLLQMEEDTFLSEAAQVSMNDKKSFSLRWWKKNRVQDSHGDPIRLLYAEFLQMMAKLQHHRFPDQTASEFAEELALKYPEWSLFLRKMTDLYEQRRYGDKPMSGEKRAFLQAELERMKNNQLEK